MSQERRRGLVRESYFFDRPPDSSLGSGYVCFIDGTHCRKHRAEHAGRESSETILGLIDIRYLAPSVLNCLIRANYQAVLCYYCTISFVRAEVDYRGADGGTPQRA